jgi:acyl-coenzyme A synthetase/AMP-(fatty) acid ligase/acyl carrier protein
VTSLSFDVVLRELFLPLTSGGTLCLPERQVLDPTRVVPWLARDQVTIVHAVPTLARVWLSGADAPPADLRLVFFAGESLSGSLVSEWRRRLRFAGEVVNLYGPTETTLAKCFFVVPPEPDPAPQPVGRPLPETQALVLTPSGDLADVGEQGEIVIRTPFRTLGSLGGAGRDALFRRNPFTDDTDDLVYYTGDAGRYRPDGELEILGRLDDQVKIRGVRVDPHELEVTLSGHPLVREVAAVARPGPSGSPKLVVYVVPADDAGDVAGGLRRFVLERLPSAFLPSAIVTLERFPVTQNGKLDREALPDAPRDAGDGAGAHVAPALDPLERRLATVWEDVLEAEPIGPEADFFDLGGDSLAAIQAAAALEEELGFECPPETIFEHPSIRELAAAIRTTSDP